MKKSTILLLLIVFLGSVLIVGIFGMQSVPFEEIVYIKEIVPHEVVVYAGGSQSTMQAQADTDKGAGHYYIMIPLQDDLVVNVIPRINPTNSTNKNLKITIVPGEGDDIATIGTLGEININGRGTVHLRYSAQDSATGAVMHMYIYVYRPRT